MIRRLESLWYLKSTSKDVFLNVSIANLREIVISLGIIKTSSEDNSETMRMERLLERKKDIYMELQTSRQDLRIHMRDCQDKNCETPNCMFYKYILFFKCAEKECPLCFPQKEKMRMYKGEEYKEPIC